MIASLPMRVLVDSLAQRFEKYLKASGLSVAALHGQRPDSPLFLRDVIVSTIDQVVAAYTCTPLSMPVRHGNIPAGAVASAFLAFDEVHTFDPERALQSALLMAEHSQKMRLPFVVMSATLPDSFVEFMKQKFNAELVDVSEQEIPLKRTRNVDLHLGEFLTAEHIQEAWGQTEGSLLVVCNTVDRAQALYEQVYKDMPARLLHSRFTDEDRKKIEEDIQPMLGKGAIDRSVLISTQVVEVGLDISTRLLLTELAPIDALIQRAGRVARWGGEGTVRIFDVENAAPYEKSLVNSTKEQLDDHFKNGGKLNWEIEKAMVSNVLNDWFKRYLGSQQMGRVLFQLAEGSFNASRSQVEKAVRENLSCEISIYANPAELGRRVWWLPKVKVPVSKLYRFTKDNSLNGIMRVKIDSRSHANIDQRSELRCEPLQSTKDLVPNGFYILSPDICAYPPNLGLLLGRQGKSFDILPFDKSKDRLSDTSERESWQEHSNNVLREFYRLYEPNNRNTIKKLADWWRMDYKSFFNFYALAVLLHDLGKLGQEWQDRAGRKEGEAPLGHTGDNLARNLPPHATVSAYALGNLLVQQGRLGDIMQYAIAHHHSVRAIQVPKYKFIPNWKQELEGLLSQWPELAQLCDSSQIIFNQPAPMTLESRLPKLSDARAWRTYAIVSRYLRFSDRVATGGGEHVLFRYEDWLADV